MNLRSYVTGIPLLPLTTAGEFPLRKFCRCEASACSLRLESKRDVKDLKHLFCEEDQSALNEVAMDYFTCRDSEYIPRLRR